MIVRSLVVSSALAILATPVLSEDVCNREPGKVGIFGEKVFAIGVARSAYFAFLKNEAVRQESCDCLMGLYSFDEFLEKEFDTSAERMTEEEYMRLIGWNEETSGPADRQYISFRRRVCEN